MQKCSPFPLKSLNREIRDSFKFIGSPLWFKAKTRNKRRKSSKAALKLFPFPLATFAPLTAHFA